MFSHKSINWVMSLIRIIAFCLYLRENGIDCWIMVEVDSGSKGGSSEKVANNNKSMCSVEWSKHYRLEA